METFDLINFEIVDISELTDSEENSETCRKKKKKDGGCGLFGGKCKSGCGCGLVAGMCGMGAKQ
jgi:hypothetical protein